MSVSLGLISFERVGLTSMWVVVWDIGDAVVLFEMYLFLHVRFC